MELVYIFVILGCFHCISSITESDLYPFGRDVNDNRLKIGDDISSDEIYLKTPIAFYDELHDSVFVNTNGHLSFGTELPGFRSDLILPFGYKIIAPFFADIDINLSGNVYYRETEERSLLDKASRDIGDLFPDGYGFRPYRLFIVTWDEVGYYKAKYDKITQGWHLILGTDTVKTRLKINTFQVVIASDGVDSYVFFHYPTGGIEWIKSEGKFAPDNPDIPAQAGFDAGDRRRSFILPGSGNPEVAQLPGWSNVNIPGIWLFRIGDTNGGEIKTPKEDDVKPAEPTTCSTGGSLTCHSNADCVDHPSGYCCQCQRNYYGNGLSCIKNDAPQRVNGKVKGTLNDVFIDSVDLHAYIVINDGRSYTAISRVPSSLGHAMQTLYVVGDILGWLFALPLSVRARNGFGLTGGDFNRTVLVTFTPGNHKVTIKQTGKSENALGYMSMDTEVEGKLPNIPKAQVKVKDFTQEFRRISQGVIKSYSTRTYTVNDIAYRFTVDETIRYTECDAAPFNDVAVMRLSVSRPFVVYGEKEEIVRFATSNKVGRASGGNPCIEQGLNCDSNADCEPAGAEYRCRCRQGYQGDGQYCQDTDECQTGKNDCHPELSRCTNTPGSFTCECLPGYIGDGRKCKRDQTCADVQCHVHARCVYDSEQGIPKCECGPGFYGDGVQVCTRIEFGCNEVNNCDPNAECVLDEEENHYVCECTEGYSGDGFYCTDTGELELSCHNCDRNADCVYDIYRLTYVCQCNAGYTGDGNRCDPIETEDCSTLRNCDRNALCTPDQRTGQYACICNRGYVGDGYYCVADEDQNTCDVLKNCDRNAQCLFSPDRNGYACLCNPGYSGDGLRCVEDNCNVRDICDVNAKCIYDEQISTYKCRCDQGYEGDGRQCSPSVTECNVVNNCDANAECVQDLRTGGYICRCRQGYEGDGYRCEVIANCRDNPGLCDENAGCQRSGIDFICVCNTGFRGDGFRCTSVSAAGDYLIVNQGMSILQVPFQPSANNGGKVILHIPGQLAIGVDVDCYERYMYWTDVVGKAVSRAKMDGTDSSVLLENLDSPEGIAIDWISRNMYITDSGSDTISVAKLDGSESKVLFRTGLVNPRAIQVDPVKGLIFWADWNRAAPKIERANMDGTDRITLVSEGLELPNGLTIDPDNERICWADAGTRKLECTGYDPNRRRRSDLIYRQALYPFGLAHANGNFYWTDWSMNNLPYIREYANQPEVPLSLPLGGNGKLYGLVAVKDQCPRGSNACYYNNGGCRFLCLPSPEGRRTCVCPDNIDQEECNRIGLLL